MRKLLSSPAGLACGLATFCCAMASALAVEAAVAPTAGGGDEPARLSLPAPPEGEPTLEELRGSALLGSLDASAALASRLLDRYERSGDRADLHEALQWIARDWDQAPYLRTDIANRVVSGHCDRAALKSHWLCRYGD